VTTGEIRPSREQFRVLAAAHPVVPVTRRLLADGETPVGVYRKLAGGPDTFLLESAEHGRSWSRYSFVGVRCPARLVERDGVAVWDGAPPPGLPASGEPFAMLKASVAALRAPRVEGLPPLLGGLVGFVSYDAVRRLERLPEHTVDDLGVPELELLLATDLAVLDHSDGSVLLVADAFTTGGDLGTAHHSACDSAYDDAVARLESMTADLSRAAEPTVATLGDVPDADLPSGFAGFRDAVTRATEEIRAGECFQVVVSQRFDRPTTASALDIYRVLRTLNPSPYMYLLRFDGHDVVGSSPEALVTVSGGRARIHPIAGTRWRPWPQRPRAGLPPRHGAGGGVRHRRALQPRDAHRVHRGRGGGRGQGRGGRAGGHVPGRDAFRSAQAAGHGDHRRAGTDAARALRRGDRLPRPGRRP
jgi:anthranilate synthase component 1